MMTNENSQHPPCFVCGQVVKKVCGPQNAEGPMCTRECARAYFVARQIATVRGMLEHYLKAQQGRPRLVGPGGGS